MLSERLADVEAEPKPAVKTDSELPICEALVVKPSVGVDTAGIDVDVVACPTEVDGTLSEVEGEVSVRLVPSEDMLRVGCDAEVDGITTEVDGRLGEVVGVAAVVAGVEREVATDDDAGGPRLVEGRVMLERLGKVAKDVTAIEGRPTEGTLMLVLGS